MSIYLKIRVILPVTSRPQVIQVTVPLSSLQDSYHTVTDVTKLYLKLFMVIIFENPRIRITALSAPNLMAFSANNRSWEVEIFYQRW